MSDDTPEPFDYAGYGQYSLPGRPLCYLDTPGSAYLCAEQISSSLTGRSMLHAEHDTRSWLECVFHMDLNEWLR